MRRRVKLTYPQDMIKEPLLFKMAKEFNVMPNIRRARVTESMGEIVLELEGAESDIDKGIGYLKDQGVIIEPVEGDVVE